MSSAEQPENSETFGTEPTSAKSKHRSPPYPFVSLKRAIERAKAIYDIEKRHAVGLEVVAKHWGFKIKSSGLLQTVAALRQFGLLAPDEGNGLERKIRLSERAVRILIDQREDERRKAVREAALSPKLYAELWILWGNELPSDANGISVLAVDMGFNPEAAAAVLQGYKETLRYAGDLSLSSVNSPGQAADEREVEAPVGDARREEVTPAADDKRPPPNVVPRASSARMAPFLQTFASAVEAEVGEEEHLRAKLSGGRSVRVLFHGPPPTQREIAKLIALLELSKDEYPLE